MKKGKNLAQAYSAALKAARKQHGLFQKDVAKLLNLSLKEYNNLERGSSIPSAQTAIKIYRVLGVSLYELDFVPDED